MIYGTERLLITAATDTTAAVYETDAELRARIQAAPEAFSTAGPGGAYIYHAKTADPSIKDVGFYAYGQGQGLREGEVRVYLLTRTGNGVPDAGLCEKVLSYFKDGDDKIPATDILSVLPAAPANYAIAMKLLIPAGPDPLVLKQRAETAAAKLVADRHKVGGALPLAAISRAGMVEGVEDVVITSPAAGIPAQMGAAPYCTSITITTEIL